MSHPSGFQPQPAPYYGPGGASVPGPPPPAPVSRKSFLVTWLLAAILGCFGADRFYLGKIPTALGKLFTLGGLGVWAAVDVGLVLFGEQRDKFGRQLRGYREHRVAALTVTAVFLVLGMGAGVTGVVALPRLLAPTAEPTQEEEQVAPPSVQEWAEEQFGTFEATTFEGDADDTFSIPAEMAKNAFATVEFESSDDEPAFLVRVIDINESVSMVAGTDGASAEISWIQGYSLDAKRVEVQANGPWSMTLEPLHMLPELELSGTDDQYFLYGGPGGRFRTTFDRGAGMSVSQYFDNLADPTLVTRSDTPEVDAVSEQPLRPGPSILFVGVDEDDTEWSITPEEPGGTAGATTPPE